MKIRRVTLVTGLVAVAATALFYSLPPEPVVAQSGARGAAQQQPFEARFWRWLQDAQYRNWAPAPGQGLSAYPGQAPHGAFLKMYLNRTAAAEPQDLPHGSIIVKENFGKDQETLMAVTVMYRTKGYDPENYDWYWIKYNPDGTVAQTPPDKGSKPIQGRFPSCINCHGGADGDDLAFFNDGN